MSNVESAEVKYQTAAEMEAEFAEKFNIPASKELYIKLVAEEAKELQDAVASFLKELADLSYVTLGAARVGVGEEGDVPLPAWFNEVVEAIPIEIRSAAFVRVHNSNMSKLGKNGKPRHRKDGKLLKGPNYKAPDLTDLVSVSE